MINLFVDNANYTIVAECNSPRCVWRKDLGHQPTDIDVFEAAREHKTAVVTQGPVFMKEHGLEL